MTFCVVYFYSASEIRAVDPIYAQGYKIVFSDLYPFLVISQVSEFSIRSTRSIWKNCV